MSRACLQKQTVQEVISISSTQEEVISISSTDEPTGAEPRHIQEKAPHPEAAEDMPVPAMTRRERACSSETTMDSSASKLPGPDEDACLQRQTARKAPPSPHHEVISISSTQDEVISISSTDEPTGAEPRHIQDNAPHPESAEQVTVPDQTRRESTCSSKTTWDSSASKVPRPDEDGILQMLACQNSEEPANPPCPGHTCVPVPPGDNNEYNSSEHGTQKMLKKIYYVHVQLKRGVAVLFDTKEGWEPPSKKIRMETMTYIGKAYDNNPFFQLTQKRFFSESEPGSGSRAKKERKTAERPAEPSALEKDHRPKTPEWLVAHDRGFRCMACCRVFPSLELLQEHVENGVNEGFSCHVFHRAMAHLKYKKRMRDQKKKRRRQYVDARRKNILA